jgi:hypothetical protein
VSTSSTFHLNGLLVQKKNSVIKTEKFSGHCTFFPYYSFLPYERCQFSEGSETCGIVVNKGGGEKFILKIGLNDEQVCQ